ncbi:putative short-chain dehydrogenase [Rhizodiscina lignyota]|uniref:Short-chain dehydrogenase n=1 Tax=Rhizodiscina lignyota TaxID=1504668 RepID=A0A9P4M3L7_9PEZI|nr:putative short-chain dehydrogenase [Rhizodiscina lignyota]
MADIAQMSLTEKEQLFKPLVQTNVTKTAHREGYSAISPTRAELSQAGRTVLVTGGGTGIGYAIARSFVRASAATVIIIGRRSNVLATAASSLEQEAKAARTNTKIITRTCDVVEQTEVEALWKDLAAQAVTVDVLVANAAKVTEAEPLLELGADEVWSQVETNAKGPLYFIEKFYSQKGEKQKFLINVSTLSIHMTGHPGVAIRPAYTLSKMTGTLLFQLIAQNVPREVMQVISFHPGTVYSGELKSMGLPREWFDSDELCGGFAVWAATKEAAFLHGRFVWAAWDVDELSTGEIRKRIEEDPYFLRASIVGLNGGLLA